VDDIARVTTRAGVLGARAELRAAAAAKLTFSGGKKMLTG
jgi:hypothetical protein